MDFLFYEQLMCAYFESEVQFSPSTHNVLVQLYFIYKIAKLLKEVLPYLNVIIDTLFQKYLCSFNAGNSSMGIQVFILYLKYSITHIITEHHL